MGYWVNEDTYQFEDERDLSEFLGINLDTMEGDYREALQHMITDLEKTIRYNSE